MCGDCVVEAGGQVGLCSRGSRFSHIKNQHIVANTVLCNNKLISGQLVLEFPIATAPICPFLIYENLILIRLEDKWDIVP